MGISECMRLERWRSIKGLEHSLWRGWMVGRVGSGRKGSVTKAEEELGRKRRLMLRKECSLLRYQVA